MVEADSAADCKRTVDWLDDESNADIADGRLSAIMPRKLFQDDAAVKSGLLQVFVRMKPLPAATATCMVLDHNNLLKATWRNTEAVYKFSQVFQQETDQEAVYAGTTSLLVEDFLSFRQPSAVVMAYGVTSAGKTFTMQGTSDKPGLVPLALRDIFQSLHEQNRANERVSLSVCEIYNENIHDLLAPVQQRAKPAALRLKETKSGTITVMGAVEVEVHSAKEALDLLRKAAKARQSAGTGVNEHSSRSHAVITVKLQTAASDAGQSQDASKQSFLHFVDLAGCERVKRTGNSGARLRESVAINSSLMTLARCLEVLRYNQQHPADQKVIPYRESKITHLFKGVLHGHGRFVMVVNVSPASEAFNETKRVLQYAALASKVTMTSEVEHDIAGEAWPSASNIPAGSATQAAATAGAAAAAAAASAALSAAQARIEELLDDKADLEYEIDVVERKVELLREELIKSEVEKEQLEADIRAEVQGEMQQLINEATATAKSRAAQAEDEAAAWKQKVSDLQQQLDAQAAELQQLKAEQTDLQVLQDALDEAKHTMLPRSEHQQLLKEAQDQAAAAAEQQQASYDDKVAAMLHDHQAQVSSLQAHLSAAKAEAEALQQRLSAAEVQAQQQIHAANAAATQQVSDLKALVADALRLLERAVAYQQTSAADAQELASTAAGVHAALSVQRQRQCAQNRSMQQEIEAADVNASAEPADAAGTATISAEQAATCDTVTGNCRNSKQSQQQPPELQAAREPEQPTACQTHPQHASHCTHKQQQQQACSSRGVGAGCTTAAAAEQQQAEPSAGPRRRTRRATLAGARPVISDTGPQDAAPTAAIPQELGQQESSPCQQSEVDITTRDAVTAAADCKRRKQTSAAGSAAAADCTGASQQAEPAADSIAAERKLSPKRKRGSRRSTSRPTAAAAPQPDVKLSQQQAHGVAGSCLSGRLPLCSIAEADEGNEEHSLQQQQAQCLEHAGAVAQGITAVDAGAEPEHRPPATRKRRRAREQDADMSCQQPEVSSAVAERSQRQQEQEQEEEGREEVPASGSAEPDRRKRRKTVETSSLQQHQEQLAEKGTQGTVEHTKQGGTDIQQPAEDIVQPDSQDLSHRKQDVQPAAGMQEAVQPVSNVCEEEQVQPKGRSRSAGSSRSCKANKGALARGTRKAQKAARQKQRAADKDEPPGPQQLPQNTAQAHHLKSPKQQHSQAEEEHVDGQAAAVEQEPPRHAAAVRPTKSNKAGPVGSKLERKAAKQVTIAQDTPAVVADQSWQPAERVLKDVTQQQLGVAVGRRATFAAGGSAATAALGRKGTSSSKQQQLPHIAGGITPVAFRTRHKGAR